MELAGAPDLASSLEVSNSRHEIGAERNGARGHRGLFDSFLHGVGIAGDHEIFNKRDAEIEIAIFVDCSSHVCVETGDMIGQIPFDFKPVITRLDDEDHTAAIEPPHGYPVGILLEI